MQQPAPPMMPAMSSFPPANITTEQIQKCLDENKKLILAILDNQNLGKLAECAQYQAQLQKNLMYLAAIADAQPQMASVPTQMPPHPAMQQGAFYMQQQQGVFPPRTPTQFGTPLQLHGQQQHQQTIPGQMNFRPAGPSNSMPPMQTDGTVAGPASRGPPTASDAGGGHRQDGLDAGSVGDGRGTSAGGAGHGGGGGDPSYMKGSEEEK